MLQVMESIMTEYSSNAVGHGPPSTLTDLIYAYRVALSDYTDHAPDEEDAAKDFAERSYRSPRNMLIAWDSPAATFAEATSAIKMAFEADLNDDAELVGSMVRAAHRYFDRLS